jgi:CubicO group peptidase (beta-lactamase class C family)
VLCAKLVDEGKLSWDTPLCTYAPEVRFYDPFTTSNVTLRDLLAHRTGVPRHEYSWFCSPLTRAELAQNLRYLEPNQPFRTKMQYNNYGYIVAGYLIEKATGLTWEQCLQKYIFDPLGMSRTNAFVDDIEFDPNHAAPYGLLGVGMSGDTLSTIYRAPGEDRSRGIGANYGPAGSINSTVEDMLKYLRFQLGDGTCDGQRLLSQEAMDEMHKPNILLSAPMDMPMEETTLCCYSMGWFIEQFRGHRVVQHGGNIDGYSAQCFMVPDLSLGIVALTNMDGSFLHMAIERTIVDHYLGVSGGNWFDRYYEFSTASHEGLAQALLGFTGQRQEGTQPSHPLESYTGDYARDGYGPCSVSLRDGTLVLNIMGGDVPLEHYHYDTFLAKAVVGELPPGIPVHFHTAEVGGAIDAVLIPLETSPGSALIRFSKKES